MNNNKIKYNSRDFFNIYFKLFAILIFTRIFCEYFVYINVNIYAALILILKEPLTKISAHIL